MARRRTKRHYSKRRTRTYTKRPIHRMRSPIKKIINNGFVQSRRTLYVPLKTIKKVRVKRPTIYNSRSTQIKQHTVVRSLPYSLNQNNFRKSLICAKRRSRKEVLHAFNKTGKSGQKRPIRNQNRNIKC